MILALTMIVTMTVSGCGPRNVVVPTIISGTIKPVAMIAQAIAGTALQVQVLAGDNGTSLQNVKELVSRSAVVFQTGASVDAWSNGMKQGSVRFISLSVALDKGTPGCSWLSFRDAADMARLMRDTLDVMYPDQKHHFATRYEPHKNQCSKANARP